MAAASANRREKDKNGCMKFRSSGTNDHADGNSVSGVSEPCSRGPEAQCSMDERRINSGSTGAVDYPSCIRGAEGEAPAALELERRPPSRGFNFWRYQQRASEFYKGDIIQITVASLICANFLCSIAEKQMDPTRQLYVGTWEDFDVFFNVVFSIELAVNMYGHWLCEFWSSGWSVFDFLVVSICLLDQCKVPLPGPLKMLRMMRAFRVFRLFKKIKSLNKIVVSLIRAVPGMSNAFFINLLFMSIYAVLGVDFFGHSKSVKRDCESLERTMTARGTCHGIEYFATFARSLYSLFQVLTGDSWSENIVRPLFFFFKGPVDQFFTGMFFVSFILINAIILINVVVAVLLDKMNAASSDEGDAECTSSAPAVVDYQQPIDSRGASPEQLTVASTRVNIMRSELDDMSMRMRSDVQSQRERVAMLSKQILAIQVVLDKVLVNLSARPTVKREIKCEDA